jgi:hypothetical protein
MADKCFFVSGMSLRISYSSNGLLYSSSLTFKYRPVCSTAFFSVSDLESDKLPVAFTVIPSTLTVCRLGLWPAALGG